jgi:hypothetical protein
MYPWIRILDMRVVTKQALIATVAERFRETHQRRSEWLLTAGGADAAVVYAQLIALPTNTTEASVIAALGDNRWTENVCDECGKDCEVTIILGEEIHHPTDMKAICLDCLEQAKRLAKSQT